MSGRCETGCLDEGSQSLPTLCTRRERKERELDDASIAARYTLGWFATLLLGTTLSLRTLHLRYLEQAFVH